MRSPSSTAGSSATNTSPVTSHRPTVRSTRRDGIGWSSAATGPGPWFQQVDELPASTWPGTGTPQQVHLDLSVTDERALAVQHERVLGLGARLLLDRSDDPAERLYVYADPGGHPFCIFVAPD